MMSTDNSSSIYDDEKRKWSEEEARERNKNVRGQGTVRYQMSVVPLLWSVLFYLSFVLMLKKPVERPGHRVQ